MNIDYINEAQEAHEKKKKQEILRNEYKQRQVLIEIKCVFLDAFNFQVLDQTKPIMEKLSNIVHQVHNEDLDTNAKFVEWSERKFQMKVNEKIFGETTLSQVELVKKIENIKEVLENIFSLYSKLCDSSFFTQETNQRILSLERNLKVSSM